MTDYPEDNPPSASESTFASERHGSPTPQPPQESSPAGQYEDMQSLMDSEDGGFRSLRRRQTTKGVVVSVSDEAVLVDVGAKSEGVIHREELSEEGETAPILEYGQEIMVEVLEPESPQGPILSLKRARREQAWVDMKHYISSGEVIVAPVVDHNRGGALLDVRGLRGFVPLSQLVSLPPTGEPSDGEDTQNRLARLHGRQLSVKVWEVDRDQNRLILSERAADQEERARRRTNLMAEIQPGQVRRGTVRNVTKFGAFVDLGGADGLVHITELSYDRVSNPRDLVSTGQEVDVLVLDVQPEDQKIALSLKRAAADPWDTLTETYQPGQIVEVTITRLAKFGAFAQVEPGVEGLIHLTELADATPREPGQIVRTGDRVQAMIIHIDGVSRRLGLSLRQVNPTETEMTADEWHAAQDGESEPQLSAFGALSAIADSLPEAENLEPATESEALEPPRTEGGAMEPASEGGPSLGFEGTTTDEGSLLETDGISAENGLRETSEDMLQTTPNLAPDVEDTGAIKDATTAPVEVHTESETSASFLEEVANVAPEARGKDFDEQKANDAEKAIDAIPQSV